MMSLVHSPPISPSSRKPEVGDIAPSRDTGDVGDSGGSGDVGSEAVWKGGGAAAAAAATAAEEAALGRVALLPRFSAEVMSRAAVAAADGEVRR